MKRREFVTFLCVAVVAWPGAARSQKPAVPRVGYIWIGARGTDVSNAGLRQGLADLGYVVGRNLVLEERYANGNPERVPGLIAELLALNVDVLLTPGAAITLAAQRATNRILKGANPAELPIEQATEVALNINLKTAKALGLMIPEALLARADAVIE